MTTDERRAFAANYGMGFLGLPYRIGGDNPMTGFDCSGLVIEVLQAVGILPKGYDATAQGLYQKLRFDNREVAEPSIGCLAFFGVPIITHVGFCINDELMLEAGGGTSATTSVDAAIAQDAYIRVRPIASRSNRRYLDPFME